MNISEVPQQQPRYGIDPYLDWVKGEGIPVVEDYGIDLFDVETETVAALRRQRRRRAPQGPRRLRQHVRVRHRARRLDHAAAPPLRGGGLRARRPRLDPGRVRRRHASAASNGARTACSRSRSTPSTGTSTAAARERALLVSTTNLPLMMNMFHNERVRLRQPISSSPSAPARRSTSPARATSSPVRPGNHMWETNFVPDLDGDRAEGLGRPRRRRHQHHVRARRRHHARAHLGDAGRHLQEGPSPRRRLPRHVRDRRTAIRCCGTTARRISAASTGSTASCSRRPTSSSTSTSTPSPQPARYLATGVGGLRYPFTASEAARSSAPAGDEERGVDERQGGRRPDRVRGSGSAHPPHLARGDAQERRPARRWRNSSRRPRI